MTLNDLLRDVEMIVKEGYGALEVRKHCPDFVDDVLEIGVQQDEGGEYVVIT